MRILKSFVIGVTIIVGRVERNQSSTVAGRDSDKDRVCGCFPLPVIILHPLPLHM
jgi:hypothetical protein